MSNVFIIVTIIVITLIIIGGLFKSNIMLFIALGVFISITLIYVVKSFIDSIKAFKKKKMFNKILPELEDVSNERVKEYYKNKYGENVNINHLELRQSADGDVVYGNIYLDEEKNKIIFISLKYPSLEMLDIYDNLQNDDIIQDATTLIKESLKEFDVKFAIKTYKKGNKEVYDGNLEEYIINNNVGFYLTIEKKLDNKSEMENNLNYYEEFSEKVLSIVKRDLININMELIFTTDELYEKAGIKDFVEFCDEGFGIIVLYYSGLIDYDTCETDDYCLYLYPSIR